MYPIALSINGLYSYKQKCIIPFDKLTEAGIFGIFGKVGSGKSSILEAIMFAIYGQSDRLNQSGDNRNYNMMNLESNKLEVQFEFLAGTTNEHFLCEFSGKRNSKNFENVNTYTRKAAKKVEGEWQAIELEEVAQAIGLSYDNFRRTVIIPQGKFAEFLQLTDAPRIAMIKDIFNLQEFDLQTKSSSLLSKTRNEVEQQRNLLENKYAYLETNFIEEKITQLQTIEQYIKTNEQELAQKQLQLQHLKQLKTIFEEVEQKTKELAALEVKKETMQAREVFLKQYIQVKDEFEELLGRYNEKTTDLRKANKNVEEIHTKLQKTKEELQQIDELVQQLSFQQTQLHTEKTWIEPLQKLLQLRLLQTQQKDAQQRMDKGTQLIQEHEEQIKQLQQKLNLIEQKNLKLKANKIDIHTLLQTQLWHQTNENLTQTYQELVATTASAQELLQQLEDTHAKYQQQIELLEKENYENQIKQITQTIEVLTLKMGLEQAVEHIHQGNACPVCGSDEHPYLLNLTNITQELKEAKHQLKNLEKQLEQKRELSVKITSLHEKITEKAAFVKEQNQKSLQAKNALEAHQKSFVWDKTWTKETVNRLIKEQEQLSKTLEKNEVEQHKLQKSIEAAKNTLSAYQKRLNEIEVSLAGITGEIKSISNDLISLPEGAKLKSDTEIRQQIKTIEQAIQQIDTKLTKASKTQQETQQIILTLESTLQVYQNFQQEIQHYQQELEKMIGEKLRHFDIQSKESVEKILSQRLDTDKERQELTNFFNQLTQVEKEVKKLQNQTNQQSFDTVFFENLQLQLNELTIKQKQAIEEKGAIQSQIAQAKADEHAKKDLEQQLKMLENRLQNLSILASLFKGQGFVNFASTDYLHNLCQLANQRFSKLTNHGMELMLNEKNEFVIRDFLNEGKLRHIKTLSGGQLFQASLSMALALAESMRKQQQFFFLDEGFGSLDNDSLQTVLETLKNLQAERKTVGIISHVESLQQEIDTHILIENTPTKGSTIRFSY